MNLAHGLTVAGVDTKLSNMNKENLKRLYIQKRVRRALLARKGIIADSAIIGLPFRGGIEDFIEKSDTSVSNNLSKLLVLETALEYLAKIESGKREYLAPGETAPEGL